MAAQQRGARPGSSARLAPAELYQPMPRRRGSRIATPVWLILLLVAALGGCFVGRYVWSPGATYGTLGGVTSLTERQLDDVVATYELDGKLCQVTAREALAQQSSLDAVKNADGTYAMPSAESVLAAARTAVLMHEVEQRGITVSDDDVSAYARDTFGTDDIKSLCSAYTMDEQTMRDRLRDSAAMKKLREQVVEVGAEPPAEPAAPADGDATSASSDYADYIIALAGNEWDAEKGSWASEDGPFAKALKEYDVSAGSATYEAAQTAYDVAYQRYNTGSASPNTLWSEFVNGLLCETHLAMSSLVS